MRRLCLIVVVSFLPLLGCEPSSSYGPYVYPVVESGLTLVSSRPGKLSAIDAESGRARWVVDFEPESSRSYARINRPPVICPVHEAANGRLIVVYRNQISGIDSRDGTLRWNVPFPVGSGRPVCPATTPDSGIVVAYNYRYSSGTLVKFNSRGRELWSFDLPDIGPLVGDLDVDPSSGSVTAHSRTHLLSVNPTGELNWARSIVRIAPPRDDASTP